MLKELVTTLPGVKKLYAFLDSCFHDDNRNPFLQFAPPGHFYSPIPSLEELKKKKAILFARSAEEIKGIDINAHGQLRLLETLAAGYNEFPYHEEGRRLRYSLANEFFCHADALMLFMMIRHYRPKKIIEIGSGHSSALMLDTNDLFFDKAITFVFIEPDPSRLNMLLDEKDKERNTILPCPVQEVPVSTVCDLAANDILFIDSSHVVKTGSDLQHIFTHILPELRSGVLIHFHDIFWPFEYPENWVFSGRAWNENYFLQAFLQFNSAFKILLFNSYLGNHHSEIIKQCCPLFLKNTGGSLWLQKIA